MSYMRCTHCGLTINLQAAFMAARHCPRCLARWRVAVPIRVSESRVWPRPAAASSVDRERSHSEAAA